MSCIYYLNGHVFNSEIELNDFLLEKGKVYTKHKDIAFSLTGHLSTALIKVDELLREAIDLKDKRGDRVLTEDDNKSYVGRTPYIGVNRYLANYTVVDSGGMEHYLFPLFKEDNYWNKRFKNWARNDFSDEEKELIFGNKPSLKITDKATLEFYKNEIKTKWKNQCLFGDAVHSVFEAYLSQTDGKYKRDLLKEDPSYFETFKQELNQRGFQATRDDASVMFSELIDSDDKLRNIIETAERMVRELETTFHSTNLMFFPELDIAGNVAVDVNGVDKVLGVIDLLVIDEEGNPHIIDYKTSPKSLNEFSSAKRLGYTYQTGLYGRLLNQHKFDITKTRYMIVPLQLSNFAKVDDKYQITGVSMDNGFDDVTSQIRTSLKISNKLEDILPITYDVPVSSHQLLYNVLSSMHQWFPQYNDIKQYSDAEISEMLKDNIEERDDKFIYTIPGNGKEIIGTSEKDLFDKVAEELRRRPTFRRLMFEQISDLLKEAIKKKSTNGISFTSSVGNRGVDSAWLNNLLKKYCTGRWRVREDGAFDGLQELGIITLWNEECNLYDFIKVSTNRINYKYKFGNNSNINGARVSDLEYLSQQNSLIVDAVSGNLEIMEVTAALNQLNFGTDTLIGNIQVINPFDLQGLLMSNAEIIYNFNELMKTSPVENTRNKIGDTLKFATKTHLVYQLLKDIMALLTNPMVQDYRFKNLNPCLSSLRLSIEDGVEEKLTALEQLRELLETDDNGRTLNDIAKDQGALTDDHRALYDLLLIAIAELKGINFRQQIELHSEWGNNLSILMAKKGLTGNYIDNPGNLPSETLNLLTTLVTEAYLNIRSGLLKDVLTIRKKVEALEKAKGSKKTEPLYTNLYKVTENNILFKNPLTDNTLTAEEKDFLTYALDEINANRFPDEDWKNNSDIKYFQVPLLRGNSSAFITPNNLLKTAKELLEKIHPKSFFTDIGNKIGEIVDKVDRNLENLNYLQNLSKLFEILNGFDIGDSEIRELLLLRNGIDSYESNLETILLAHKFSYLQKEAINEVFPMVKASMIHLAQQGLTLNTEYKTDLKYAEEYIRNKIKGESIVRNENRPMHKFMSRLRNASSIFVLAFSPVQFTYQIVQGFWNDIRLMWQSKNTDMPFTFSNFRLAMKMVYKEMFTFDGKPTITSKLNELYGINDMDINTYALRLKLHDTSFNTLLFKFASRPDYYNRMSIFTTKMIADGSLEAHSLDDDGNLHYDCTKDARYAAYFNGTPNTKEYNEAFSRYSAVAQLFIKEHAKNEDGSDFKFGDKLPRAYTTLESESMKDLGDIIYGYYSSEKKSLIHSTMIGSLFMLFKTFWSGKKNQYLATGSVKIQGKWKNITKNVDGKEVGYYYQKDSHGNVLLHEPPVLLENPTASDIPVTQWEGDWKEGIICTIFNLWGAVKKDGIRNGWASMWYNKDENLRNAYRSNLTQLAYDTIMWMMVSQIICAALGGWKDDLKKDINKSNIIDGFRLSAAELAYRTMKNSFLDFNVIDSLFSPMVQWSPFSFDYTASQLKSVWNTITGDLDIFDGMANTSSATRTIKPVFSAIKMLFKL